MGGVRWGVAGEMRKNAEECGMQNAECGMRKDAASESAVSGMVTCCSTGPAYIPFPKPNPKRHMHLVSCL